MGPEILNVLLDTWRNQSGAVYSDEFVVRFETAGFCRVMANGNLGDLADEIIRREIEHHRGLGRSFEWTHLSCDSPDDMLSRLASLGFSIGEKEVVCLFDLAEGDLGVPSRRVVQVHDAQTLHDFRNVAEAVFQKDFAYTTEVLTLDLRSDIHQEFGFVAYDGQEPVSIGRLSRPTGAEIAGLYTGGTLSSHRRQGYYRSTIQARAQFARALGVRSLSVDARTSSLPILLGMGFHPLVESWPCDFSI